jgi:hypothetical protein
MTTFSSLVGMSINIRSGYRVCDYPDYFYNPIIVLVGVAHKNAKLLNLAIFMK